MNPYTPEQYDNMATNVRDCAWPADVKEYMVLIEPMLREAAATLRQQAERGDGAVAEVLGRFGHHPDPAIDFCVEVESLLGEIENHRIGFANGTPTKEELRLRIDAALAFKVGGDSNAVMAKQQLREAVAPLLRAPAEQGGRVDDRSVSDRIINWLRRNANASKEPVERATFIEAHNAAKHIQREAALAQKPRGETFPLAVGMSDGTVKHPTGDQLAGALHTGRARVPEHSLPMDTAPRDGTMLRLLVQFEEHATEDTAGPAWTIGANEFEANGSDEWRFAGWCWTHDHFTQGKGTPVGWLPMFGERARVPDLTALENDLIVECERAIRQRDECLKTGISTAGHGGSHDTCFGMILRKHLLAAAASQPAQDAGGKWSNAPAGETHRRHLDGPFTQPKDTGQ